MRHRSAGGVRVALLPPLARHKIFRRSVLQTQPPKRGFGFNAARAWDLGYPCAIFLCLVRQALYARC
jgi:hypothetical protein